jgi:hypothetical protein
MSAADGLWLHAVMRELDPARLAGLTGVGGRALRTVSPHPSSHPVPAAGGLTAVVCPVDLALFGEEPLRRSLEDIGWVEAVARTHHHVAMQLSRFGPVIPARLATIYLSDESVAGLLSRSGTELDAALTRITGRIEWGVKAYTAPTPPAPPPAPGPAGDRPGAGADYLRRKRAALSARSEAASAAADSAEQLHNKLASVAEAARRHPPQSRGLNPRAASMVLNGSYLVDTGRGDRFAETVAELARGYGAIEVELTGPWLPYSFALVPVAEAADG